MKGLVDGMNRASELYDEEEYYIAELLLCSDAMYNGINVLKQYLPQDEESLKEEKIKVVIGVIKGDTHDIGKNLVKIMLDTAGYEVIDLGRDVGVEDFVNAIKLNSAKILCMSSLMTTTMYTMKDVVEKLVEEGIRDSVKIMVGGGPISNEFCREIGADAYSKNAVEAVKVAKSLVS